MKKSVFGVAFAAGLMIGSVASAAPIDIVAREVSPTTWELFAQANDTGLGQIALVATGFDAMILNLDGGASISPPDSVRNPRSGNLTITGMWDLDYPLLPFSLLPAGSPEILLATLVGSDGPKTIVSGDEAFGFSALDDRLLTILDYSLTTVSADGTSVTTFGTAPLPVPEVTPPPKPVKPAPIPRPTTGPVSGGPPASAPIPEPRSVVVFAAGAIVVAWAIARSRRQSGAGARAA